jgi:CheY-like chemotaxis protein
MEPFSALLISNDASAVGITGKVLNDYDVKVDVAKTAPDMAKLMEHHRYDLAVYDQDVPGAAELASSHWVRHRPRLAMALVRNGKVKEFHGRPIHLIVPKPFTPDLLTKSIRAAYSLIVKDRRAAFRCPIQADALSAKLFGAGGGWPLENVKLINVSQSGMCIQTQEILPKGALLAIQFMLPESKKQVRAKGTVIWNDDSYKAGIKFGDIPVWDRQNLCEWLSVRTPPDSELAPKPGVRRQIDGLPRP